MKKRIYLSPPHLSENVTEILQQTIESNWIAPIGENLDNFEKAIADFCQISDVLALNTGTAAIHLALRLLNIQEGDIVICPTLTFVASVNPIMYLKAEPIFVDSEVDTWNMCPILLEKAIEDCLAKKKRPKAIILVHLYGNPAKLKEILALSRKYRIPVIEDSAEAFGSTYNQKKIGTFGEFGILSFNGNKIITTSAGGAILCKNKETRDKALYLATQAREPLPYYEHKDIGYNYRLSNVLAGIGVNQMTVLEDRVRARRNNYTFYFEHLSKIDKISFQKELENALSNRWLTCILLDESSTVNTEQIRLALAENNIESRPIWKPMHLQEIYKNVPYYTEKDISKSLFKNGLCLPSGSSLSEEELTTIINIVKTCFTD